jgi:hypothetical protein
MAAGQVKYLPGYPAVPGNKKFAVIDVYGPTSYTQVGAANPITGGQALFAKQFGLNKIEAVFIMGAGGGLYTAVPHTTAQNPAIAANKITLQWVLSVSGAEVAGATNLSAVPLRICAIGNY